MTRKSIHNYEESARWLCRRRGYDPDRIVNFNDKDQTSNKRPLWMNYADQLRAHDERREALEWQEEQRIDAATRSFWEEFK